MRDKDLIAARPILNLITENSTDIENFQNKTLRPILKMQHPITKMMLDNSEHYIKMKTKVNLEETKAVHELIEKYVSNNVVFRSQLIGCIIGMMTEEEIAFYLNHKSELNKRIVTMQKERFMEVDG